MKKRNGVKIIAAGAMAILLCVLAAMPVFGMTPIEPYGAVPHFALYPAGGQSLLAIKSLKVTWQIDDLPGDYDVRKAKDYHAFLEYQPRVQATYLFENPTDQPIRQGLYLPAALPPEYARWENADMVSRLLEQYRIELNGKTVEPTVRYAYVSEARERYRDVVYANDDTMQALLARAVGHLDGHALDADTPVTVYSYVPKDPLKPNGGSEMLDCRVQVAENGPLVFIPGMYGNRVEKDAKSGEAYVNMGGYVYYGDVIKVYVIGEGEVTVDTWKVGRVRSGEEMVLQGTAVTTLGTLAMQHYDPSWGVTSEDWYCAVSTMLQDKRIEQSNVITDYAGNGWNVKADLQPMLYYEIEIAPQTTATNTVEQLAYPGQWPSGSRNVTLGTWTFVPPTQECFASVEQIELHIATSLYMSEVSYYYTHKTDAYTPTEQGYSIQIAPDEPIVRFTLCNKSNYGTADMIVGDILGLLRILLFLSLFLLPGVAITGIVLLYEHKSSRKRAEKKQAKENGEIN